MRITGLEARRYTIPLDPPFNAAWDPQPRERFEDTIVIVDTDSGVRGYAGGAPVPDLKLLESLLVGSDLGDTRHVFEVCRTVDFHHGRNWTVEIAVHDALARANEQPLWKLLGGSREAYPAYASTGERLVAEARVERTLRWRDQGIVNDLVAQQKELAYFSARVEFEKASYELRVLFRPKPEEKPPQFEQVSALVLEIEPRADGGEALTIDKGQKAGLSRGQRGRLLEKGETIGEIEVLDVYEDAARVAIVGTLRAPITPSTVAEVDVPL